MYSMMKKQNFGVEIELTGITREQAANVIATYFGTRVSYLGTYYKTYGATDRKGRTWKAMSDGSIKTERKTSQGRITAGSDYSCEVVTPVLQYEDMEDLQNVIRALREAGAIANSSCGIHIHVDGKNHTPASLGRDGDALAALLVLRVLNDRPRSRCRRGNHRGIRTGPKTSDPGTPPRSCRR